MTGKRFVLYVPEKQAIEPLDGRCIVNSWWVVHPHRGLAFYEYGADAPSPQCNVDHRVLASACRPGDMYEGHEAKFIPAVFVEHAVRERARLRETNDAHKGSA